MVLNLFPIYLEHPDVESLTLVETNVNLLRTVQERYGIPDENCFTDLQQVLDNPNIDAVHLVTPPSTHAPLSIKVLESGKHCGCTIPMGMSIDELHQVIAARKKSGKNYMFLETTVFQREYFYVKELMDKGDFGKFSICPALIIKIWKGGRPIGMVFLHSCIRLMPSVHASCS